MKTPMLPYVHISFVSFVILAILGCAEDVLKQMNVLIVQGLVAMYALDTVQNSNANTVLSGVAYAKLPL
jgi:Flp pilus assembly protein protease CpaA